MPTLWTGRRYILTVFREHLDQDECSGGKVSSTPTPIVFAICSRDTQPRPRQHTMKNTGGGTAQMENKPGMAAGQGQHRAPFGTQSPTSVCAASLNALELSDLVHRGCKETCYHHNMLPPQHTAVVGRVGTFCKSHGDSLEPRPQLSLKRKAPQTRTGV